MFLLVIIFLVLLALVNKVAALVVTGLLILLVGWATTTPTYKAKGRRRGR